MGNEIFFRLVQHYQGSDVQEYIMQTYTHSQESFKRHHVSVWESSTRVELTLMILSITLWCFVIFLSTLGYIVARTRFKSSKRSHSSQLPVNKAPGVSIIRPLKGEDCNLFENLSSSFRQDYPKFEIIFSVANDDDPAIGVVQKLMKDFPNVDAKLIIEERFSNKLQSSPLSGLIIDTPGALLTGNCEECDLLEDLNL
ncbi:18940_t:CDS:2, partial [Gigaspora rosea]